MSLGVKGKWSPIFRGVIFPSLIRLEHCSANKCHCLLLSSPLLNEIPMNSTHLKEQEMEYEKQREK